MDLFTLSNTAEIPSSSSDQQQPQASTSTEISSSTPTEEKSALAKKIRRDIRSNTDVEDNPECYIFINTDIIRGIIDLIGVCPSRKSAHLNIQYNISRKRGLAHLLSITCPECALVKEFSTYKEIKKNNNNVTQRGRNMFDINLRSCIAFREMGKGLTGMETFCSIMNCPPPMNLETCNNIDNKMHHAYVEASRKSMLLAAKETHSNVVKETDGGTHEATGWMGHGNVGDTPHLTELLPSYVMEKLSILKHQKIVKVVNIGTIKRERLNTTNG